MARSGAKSKIIGPLVIEPVALAWATGLFEGEGCINLHWRKSRLGTVDYANLRLTIRMTDEEPIRAFRHIMQIGRVREMFPPSWRAKSRKCMWEWAVESRQARAALRAMYPLLSPRRQRKADEVFALSPCYGQPASTRPHAA